MTINEMSRFKSGDALVWRPLNGKGPFNVKMLRFDRGSGLATVRITDSISQKRKLATLDWVVTAAQLEVPHDS